MWRVRSADEHFRAGDDLKAGRVVLADPGLVVIEPVEVDEQLHVALEGQERVFPNRMEGSKKDAGLQKPVGITHGAWPS
jgi:hypothetical protein